MKPTVRASAHQSTATVWGGSVFALAGLVMALTFPRLAVGDELQGAIAGWGSQVVGVDLSGDSIAVAAGSHHSLGFTRLWLSNRTIKGKENPTDTRCKNIVASTRNARASGLLSSATAFAVYAIAQVQVAERAQQAAQKPTGISDAQLDEYLKNFADLSLNYTYFEMRAAVIYKLVLNQGEEHVEALARAGLKRRPPAGLWARDLGLLAATWRGNGRTLEGERREAHFRKAFTSVRESCKAVEAARDEATLGDQKQTVAQQSISIQAIAQDLSTKQALGQLLSRLQQDLLYIADRGS